MRRPDGRGGRASGNVRNPQRPRRRDVVPRDDAFGRLRACVRGGRAPAGREVGHDRRLVEGDRLALDDGDGALRALAEAGAQAVAQGVGGEARLPVDERDGALGAGRDALAAAVALRLVDLDDLPEHGGALIARRGGPA